MKVILIIIILSSALFKAKSQSQDTSYLQFLQAKIRRIQPYGIIYYVDKPIISRRNMETIPKAFGSLKKNEVAFTDSEKKYILSSVRMFKNQKWKDSLFLNSKRLSSDSIVPFVEKIVKGMIDSLRQLPDKVAASNYYMHNKPWAFFFSSPIFLRKRTILICYFMYYVNSSGEEGVFVYKRSADKWVGIGALAGGAW